MDEAGAKEDRPREGRLEWTLTAIFVTAVLVNYPWELAQSRLYIEMGNFRAMWWHCFVASVGDGLLVLLIFAIGWITLRRQDWFVCPKARGFLVMVAAGLVIGVSVEWTAVHMAGRWVYPPQMPLCLASPSGLSLFCKCSCCRR